MMTRELNDETKIDFLVSAEEINNNRVFPNVEDGLKPSQRACLWTAYVGGFSSNKPHVKNAKIDGDVTGNYWAHGSEYGTIVRMSQNWLNNIPEFDFHGNNGSLKGGPDPAASRYTESRLSKATEDGLFEGIEKNAVDMIDNFSGKLKWPKFLPALMPRLFVNGAAGIGYTIANDWQPGNLNEFTDHVVEYLKTGKLDCSNIYPDFPSGGTIINKSAVKSIYETGTGTAIVRGDATIDGLNIDITSLPHQVYVEPFIQSVKDAINSGALTGINDIINMCDKDHFLIRIECSDNPEVVLNRLYNKTSLQSSFSANQMALVDGFPRLLNLKDYIDLYVAHNLNCLMREFQFDLDKAKARQEVVEGLIRAIGMIDDIIDLVRKSKSSEVARENLISKYSFTENQAKAIISMQLGKLANLEVDELNKEEKELNKTIEKCNKIINSKSAREKEFITRLTEFTKKYGWERRTKLDDIDIVKEKSVVVRAPKAEEEYIISLTNGGFLKKTPVANYKSPTKFASNDDIIKTQLKMKKSDKVICIGEDGFMYKVVVKDIAQCNANAAGSDTRDIIGIKIINIFSGEEKPTNMIMLTANGRVKRMPAINVFSISKKTGSVVFGITEDDAMVMCRLYDDLDTFTFFINDKQYKCNVDGLNIQSGRAGTGKQLVNVKKGQTLHV